MIRIIHNFMNFQNVIIKIIYSFIVIISVNNFLTIITK